MYVKVNIDDEKRQTDKQDKPSIEDVMTLGPFESFFSTLKKKIEVNYFLFKKIQKLERKNEILLQALLKNLMSSESSHSTNFLQSNFQEVALFYI